LTIGSHHLYIFIAIISGQTRKKEKRVRLHLPKTGSSKTVIFIFEMKNGSLLSLALGDLVKLVIPVDSDFNSFRLAGRA